MSSARITGKVIYRLDSEALQQALVAEGLSPGKTVLVLPDHKENHPGTQPLYQTSHNTPLTERDKLANHGVPIIGLPVYDMDVLDEKSDIPQEAKEAVANLWKAAGNGMDITVLLSENPDNPSLFPKPPLTDKTPNPHLVVYYDAQFLLLHHFLEDIKKDHSTALNNTKYPENFRNAFIEGKKASGNTPFFHQPEALKKASLENEKQLLEELISKNPGIEKSLKDDIDSIRQCIDKIIIFLNNDDASKGQEENDFIPGLECIDQIAKHLNLKAELLENEFNQWILNNRLKEKQDNEYKKTAVADRYPDCPLILKLKYLLESKNNEYDEIKKRTALSIKRREEIKSDPLIKNDAPTPPATDNSMKSDSDSIPDNSSDYRLFEQAITIPAKDLQTFLTKCLGNDISTLAQFEKVKSAHTTVSGADTVNVRVTNYSTITTADPNGNASQKIYCPIVAVEDKNSTRLMCNPAKMKALHGKDGDALLHDIAKNEIESYFKRFPTPREIEILKINPQHGSRLLVMMVAYEEQCKGTELAFRITYGKDVTPPKPEETTAALKSLSSMDRSSEPLLTLGTDTPEKKPDESPTMSL